MPNEIPGAVRFSEDEKHASYDAEYAHRFWRVLLATDRVMKQFRTGFIGKASPVHFFWGSFDLAVTRFSGGIAPLHRRRRNLPDPVAREAYSHEVSSAGFWPGGDIPMPRSIPTPIPSRRASERRVQPSEAQFSEGRSARFLLPYDAVRLSPDPDATLLSFLESTYDAAATAGKWDRPALECSSGRAGVPRALAVGR